MAGFDGATGWLNSPPLTPDGLRGKVVLVDFWTYTCINWLRTLGYVRAWAEKYRDHGLVVVGVHTPEFPFERDVDNVRRAAADMEVALPGRARHRLRRLGGVRQPLLAGRLHRRRAKDASGTTTSARAATRSASGSSSGCCATPVARGSPTISSPSPPTASRRRPTGRTWSRPRPTSATSRARTCVPGGAALDEPRTYVRPGVAAAQPVGALRRWTIERAGGVLDRGRRADRVPLPRPRRQPRHGAARREARRCRSACSSTASRPGDGARPRRRRAGQRHGRPSSGCTSSIRQPGPIADRTFEITFPAPGVEAYVFTFG